MDFLYSDSPDEREMLEPAVRACVIPGSVERRLGADGKPLNWIIDPRLFTLNGRFSISIAKLFWQRYESKWPFQVAGLELSAVPLIAAIVQWGAILGYDVSGVIVRKTPKQYGRRRQIEGRLSERAVILVDDVFHSGKSFEVALEALTRAKLKITEFFTVIDFEDDQAHARLAKDGFSHSSIFKLGEFGLKARPKTLPRRPDQAIEAKWCFEPEAKGHGLLARKARPILYDGYVYHATEGGSLFKLAPETAETMWEVKLTDSGLKRCWSTPLCLNGVVFIGCYSGILYAIDTSTGSVRWEKEIADWIGSSVIASFDGSAIYVGVEFADGEGGVACLSAEHGEIKWLIRVDDLVHASPIVLRDGNVICGCRDGRLRAFAPEDGSVLWATDLGGDIKSSPLMTDQGLLIVGLGNSCVTAVRTDGMLVWTARIAGPCYSQPCAQGNVVFVSDASGTISKVEVDTGQIKGKRQLSGKCFASPSLIDGLIVVGTTSKRLYIIHPDTLEIEKVVQLNDAMLGDLEVSGNDVYVPLSRGGLCSLSRSDLTSQFMV